MIVGYAGVSTKDQSLEPQKALLEKAGCEDIYTDVASGTIDDRKGLNQVLKYLMIGGTVTKNSNKHHELFRVFIHIKS